MFDSIAAVRESFIRKEVNTEWAKRMLHQIPDLPTVPDRSKYLAEKAKDKIVLDIGCTGPISQVVKSSSKKYYGIDKVRGDWETVELDHRPDLMPKHDDVEVIICSEVLEHLSNPGYFLLALKDKYPNRLIYFTVPNAGAYVVKDDCEVVNSEHVCWYSYQTLKTLLTRYNYEIKESRWYHGQPYKAEGLIMVVQ